MGVPFITPLLGGGCIGGGGGGGSRRVTTGVTLSGFIALVKD